MCWCRLCCGSQPAQSKQRSVLLRVCHTSLCTSCVRITSENKVGICRFVVQDEWAQQPISSPRLVGGLWTGLTHIFSLHIIHRDKRVRSCRCRFRERRLTQRCTKKSTAVGYRSTSHSMKQWLSSTTAHGACFVHWFRSLILLRGGG